MGEVLVELNAVTRGPVRHVNLFEKHAAGAEGNVAIGASRLGVSSGIITRVGDDEFGRFLLSTLGSENVDTSNVTIDKEASTGIFFVQRGYPIPNKSEIFYYRHGSAGSKLSPQDVNIDYVQSAKIFHVTGITPALSETANQATIHAIQRAKEHKVKISFDTNVRRKLWNNDHACRVLRSLCESADIIFTSPSDAKIIFNIEDPKSIAKMLHDRGVRTVVVKLGDKGSFASSNGEVAVQSVIPVIVEDPTGAGDAFAATFLATHLRGWKLTESLKAATATAALVVTVRGDFENIPDLNSLKTFLDSEQGKTEYLR
jgi:sugar/nucleoside kinase (ribokinase family)